MTQKGDLRCAAASSDIVTHECDCSFLPASTAAESLQGSINDQSAE